MKLSGTDVAPVIAGLVEVNNGRFTYRRDFEVKRGIINFDDPVKPDPSLDISAQNEVANYRVTIQITGRATAPVVDFMIDPPTRPDGSPISKLEIIALLNRGSLPENKARVVGSGSTSDDAQGVAASEALNLLAGQVEDTFERIFDFSGQNVIRQVYIDTYASEGGAPVARFNLPINLTNDIDLVVQVDQNNVRISSDYALHDSISLSGGIESNNESEGTRNKQGAAADTGVDLRFRFAFP
jgi:translocation and assembly module TamB